MVKGAERVKEMRYKNIHRIGSRLMRWLLAFLYGGYALCADSKGDQEIQTAESDGFTMEIQMTAGDDDEYWTRWSQCRSLSLNGGCVERRSGGVRTSWAGCESARGWNADLLWSRTTTRQDSICAARGEDNDFYQHTRSDDDNDDEADADGSSGGAKADVDSL